MKDKILTLLKAEQNLFISGEEISNKLKVSRASIWKYVQKLRDEGYTIEATTNKGYRLSSSPDLLTYEEIKDNLTTKYIGNKILHFDSIDSTNNKAKALALEGEIEGTVIIAEEQSCGRGRMGRVWFSTRGKGIFMSIIARPNISPERAGIITQITAAAVGKAIENFSLKPSIKWPNDIYINDKKVCGILTEMSCEFNEIHHLIIGIGLNVNQVKEDFTEELLSTATSMKIELKQDISRRGLIADILSNFESLYDEFILYGNSKTGIAYCRENSFLLGKNVSITKKGTSINVKCLDISGDGNLIVQYSDGKIENLFSGEVTLKNE